MTKEHHITIQERSGYHSKPNVPILKLSGNYLKQAGFSVGTPAKVKVYDGVILICKE